MIKGRPILSKEIILSKISSEDIFREYCSPFNKIGEHFQSELREDKNASCTIDWIRGDLMYSDFGDGLHIRCIEYVKLKFNLSYYDALEKIYYDFKLDGIPNSNNNSIGNWRNDTSNRIQTKQSDCSARDKQPTIIKIKKRAWNEADKCYWQGRYNINKQTLIKFGVVPVSHFWIDSNKLNNEMFIADPLAYSYEFYWENNIFRRKIYQPEHKGNFGKWWSNGGLISMGEGMLPYSGDLLIVSKALKDIMCLYEFGITAIAPPSEENWFPEGYIEKQQTRFNRVVCLFDNDKSGIKRSKAFSEKYNIPYILIPEEYKSKDLSDLIWNCGKEKAKQIINKLLWK